MNAPGKKARTTGPSPVASEAPGPRDPGVDAGLVDTLGRTLVTDGLRLVMDASSANQIGPAIASMLIYVLMALVLFWRPEGLFSARVAR